MESDYLYLKPGGTKLEAYSLASNAPPIPHGMVRVVAISDTHNETKNLKVPWGHMLIHAGDVMTESGLRHVDKTKKDDLHVTVKPHGANLFTQFATWFGSQPHPHKVLIGGNHDWVMQAMGAVEISKILDKFSTIPGTIVYLEHEEAQVGGVKVFGSPYGNWGSHNNAFMSTDQDIYGCMTNNTHIMVTHYPAILPKSEGRFREDPEIAEALHRSNSLLHIGGHCHWAHGLYFTTAKKVPCVVASVCDSHWLNPFSIFGKERGDSSDRLRGGYNLHFPPIVCDLPVPGGPPADTDLWKKTPSRFKVELAIPFINPDHAAAKPKPTMIFFGPNTDPKAVQRLLPQFEKIFDVSHFDDVQEAIVAAHARRETPYDVCVSKLGSTKNLGKDLLEVLVEISRKTVIVVHSSTALEYPATQQALIDAYAVKSFVDYHSESSLLKDLQNFAKEWHNK